MASTSTHASWHPAFMPNTLDQVDGTNFSPGADEKDTSPESQRTNPTHSMTRDHESDDAPVSLDKVMKPNDLEVEPETAIVIPPSADDTSTNPPILSPTTSNKPVAQDPSPSSVSVTEVSNHAGKHLSTMSFARTISQEPNWMDTFEDDDNDLHAPGEEYDVFSQMPTVERTNSFPSVPPLEQHPEAQIQPLSSCQVEDVMETELEPELATGLSNGQIWEGDADDLEVPLDPSIGGQTQELDAGTAGTRFEEGVPLMAYEIDDSIQSDENAVAQASSRDIADVSIAQGTTEDSQTLPHLERKTTMQALGEMASEIPTSAFDFETSGDTLEEEDFLAVSAQQEPREDSTPPELDEPVQEHAPVNANDKWSQAFADDDEFLLEDVSSPVDDKKFDAAAFFGDDDEGFLDDEDDEPQSIPNDIPPPSAAAAIPVSRYAPSGVAQPAMPDRTPSNPYFPAVLPSTTVQPQVPASGIFNPAALATPYTLAAGQHPPLAAAYGVPARPEPNRAQSFADKAKGGYSSPYDLPIDVVKPRKRTSVPQPPRSGIATLQPVGPPAPPRSTSMQQPLPPPMSNPAYSNQPASTPVTSKPPPVLRNRESFFEDLPMSNKTRSASRHSNKSQASPLQSEFANLATNTSAPSSYVQPPPMTPSTHAGLVKPQMNNPYGPTSNSNATGRIAPPPAPSRYSPAPPPPGASTSGPPAAATQRYAATPPNQTPPMGPRSTSYAPAVNTSSVPAPGPLPHLPRTSSPLAQFEVSHTRMRASASTDAHSQPQPAQGGPLHHELKSNRIPSLPPTREVDEDGLNQDMPSSSFANSVPTHAPAQALRSTPPPPLHSAASQLYSSPQKSRLSYSPQARAVTEQPGHTFAPPKRSQTQSPSALQGHGGLSKVSDPIARPSSAHHSPAPQPSDNAYPQTRPRGFSRNLDIAVPTDGTQHDPLQRWRGAPLLAMGFGGTLITSFPQDIPRYGINQALPTIVRNAGQVKIRQLKDLEPMEDRLAKFPGPLKGKGKKKETLAWLSTGIDALERMRIDQPFQAAPSLESTRAAERVILWKILRTFIEHDGHLEGNAAVDKAVRDVLAPQPAGPASLGADTYLHITNGATQLPTAPVLSDGVAAATIEEIKQNLLLGNRESAVWAAADKRLWGHALLIANTVSPDLYHKVSQEFIKKEVNMPGYDNKSLATFYAVLSGNHDESVDELVPVHARAGFQLVSNDPSMTGQGLEGLDQWRETLTLILSNRSANDIRALNALGNLLAKYGRAEAAHVCFLFARKASTFGGLDDPAADFVLVGSDHKQQIGQFAKEPEAILLSEVYEYGLSLSGGSNIAVTAPHLAAYKLQHAVWLAEHGSTDNAIQYCDSIVNAINAQTKRSPYHHGVLMSAVEDLATRLRQAPKEGSSSWIPKPSIGKVSDSVWNRFNKFVAGDEGDASRSGSPKPGEDVGPFGRVQGGTPTISRPASTTNMMDLLGTSPNNGYLGAPKPQPRQITPPSTMAASRYAPSMQQPQQQSVPQRQTSYDLPNGNLQPGMPSLERMPSATHLGSYEPSRPSVSQSSQGSQYAPNAAPEPSLSHYEPSAPASSLPNGSLSAANPYSAVSATASLSPYAPQAPAQSFNPYAPTLAVPGAQDGGATNASDRFSNHQPLSSSLEPPSHTPADEPSPNEAEAPSLVGNGGFEAPSYTPYSYEPPSYAPDPVSAEDDADDAPKPKKKKGIMDDDDDDGYFPPAQTTQRSSSSGEKSKADKDRENAELFRKAAEEDAKRAEGEKATKGKKGWGLGGWFGGGGGSGGSGAAKKDGLDASAPNKPIRAKLGEKSSFYYDPDQKRWINKGGNAEEQAAPKATAPPPRGAAPPPRSVSGTPPPSASMLGSRPSTSGSMGGGGGGGPSSGFDAGLGKTNAMLPPMTNTLARSVSMAQLAPTSDPASSLAAAGAVSGPPAMKRSVSNMSSAGGVAAAAAAAAGSGPPSRPTTSMSNASSIDDLIGAAAPRKGGAGKAAKKKGGRYVDIMAK